MNSGAFDKLVRQRLPALASAPFRRYWIGSLGYDSGYQLMLLAQGWLVFKLTGSALLLGVLGAAVALPNILMTLVGGVIADRFGKRRILMITALITGLLLQLMAWLDWSGHIMLWQVLAISASISLVSGLNWPAQVSILPELVPREAMVSAVALNTVIWQSMRMLMPAIGGILMVWSDTWFVFMLAGIGGLMMFGLVYTLPTHTPVHSGESPLRQLQQGLLYIWHNDMFRWIIALTFTGMFFSQSYVQLAPLLADMMGRAEAGFGLLISASGVGAVLGTLLMGTLSQHARLGLVMLAGGLLSALALILFALVLLLPGFWLGLALLLVSALFASVFMVGSMTVLQLRVPDELRGRVMGIHTIGFSLPPLGGLWLGASSQWLAQPMGVAGGTATALCVGGAVYVGAIAWVLWRSPAMRAISGAELEGAIEASGIIVR